MSRTCPITGKRTCTGRTLKKRGIAKKKKGIGINLIGVDDRKFLPNMQKKRFWSPEHGHFITLKVSTSGLKTILKNGLDKTMRAANM